MTDTTTPPSSPFISDASTPTASPPLAQLSASLSSIAEQLVSASRAISQSHRAGTLDAEDTAARLERIEREQAALRAQLAIQVVPVTPEARVEQLEHRLQEALDIIKLDQDRLYARLHNARATVSKMAIMPLPTASGKPPPNFPATKGEFEHVTKERYEGLLKAYGLPVKGDTNAKREAVRVFIGLPV